jgi:hypothetical protein
VRPSTPHESSDSRWVIWIDDFLRGSGFVDCVERSRGYASNIKERFRRRNAFGMNGRWNVGNCTSRRCFILTSDCVSVGRKLAQ